MNSKSEQRELAEHLYIYMNMDQQQIANVVKVTPKTVTAWKQEDKWDEKRIALTLTRDHVLRGLHKEASKYLSVMNDDNLKMTPKEADAMAKITSAIEKLDKKVTIPIILTVFKEFNQFCAVLDRDFTLKMMEYQKKFYTEKKSYGQN